MFTFLDRQVTGEPAGSSITAQHAFAYVQHLGEAALRQELLRSVRTIAARANQCDPSILIAVHRFHDIIEERRHAGRVVDGNGTGADWYSGLPPPPVDRTSIIKISPLFD